MDISRSKVLVTGAGGFIGSHLVEALLGKGARVTAFVRYNSRNDYGQLEHLGKKLKDVEIYAGDLRDRSSVQKAAEGCQAIFHLGALIGIPYSYQSPGDVFANNITSTLNVLEAGRELGTARVVITSTSEVFGSPNYVPIDEKHPLQAQSPYAASKIATDKLAESFFNSFMQPVVTIRPFNTFGPRQSARAIIPTIVSQALHGDRVKLGSLDPRRDLLFVRDTVQGFIKAAETDKAVGHVINLGTGADVSIGELAQQILLIMGSKAEIVIDENRIRPSSSEVTQLVCNAERAERLIGWSPAFTLEEGLHETIAWVKNHIGTYKADQYNI